MGKFTSFDGTNIFYLYNKRKSRTTLVFLHGVGSNWTVWKKELRYFAEKGYSTLVLDLRGHGKSGAPEDFKRYKLPYFTRDIYCLLKKLRITNFGLIGHSLGAAIAIIYCKRYRRKYPHSLILVEGASTYPFKHDRMLNHGPYLTHILRFIAKHKLTSKQHVFKFHETDLSEEGLVQDMHIISHILHLTPLRTIVKTLDNVEKYVFKNQKGIDHALSSMKIPTLLIAGTEDTTVPLKFTERIHDLNKRASMKIIKGAHHEAIISKAHEVSSVINNFMNTKVKPYYR